MESLPHLKQPRVRINAESVFENLAYEAKAGHPIEEVQRKMPQTEFQAKVAHRARVFGPAAALHLHMDRAIMSRKQRLPGLPSRLVALETVSVPLLLFCFSLFFVYSASVFIFIFLNRMTDTIRWERQLPASAR